MLGKIKIAKSYNIRTNSSTIAKYENVKHLYPTLRAFKDLSEYSVGIENYKNRIKRIDENIYLACQRDSKFLSHNETTTGYEIKFTGGNKHNSNIEYHPDISDKLPLLEALHGAYQNPEVFDIIQEMWSKIYQKNLFCREKKEWIYTTKKEKCPDETYIPVLDKWLKIYPAHLGGYNFYPIFDVTNRFCKYGTQTYYPIIKLLLKERHQMIDMLQFSDQRTEESLKNVIFSVNYQSQLDASIGKKLDEFVVDFPKYQFDKVFQDPCSVMCAESMMKAVQTTPGAEQWLHSESVSIFSDSPIMHELSRKTEECGHSGNTMSWSVGTIRSIIRDGWENWVVKSLLSHGIGWNQITFQQALESGNEKCCCYIFEKQQGYNNDHTYLNLFQICVDKEWDSLGLMVLDKCWREISEEKYIEWANYTYDKNIWKLNKPLMEKWNMLYPRKIDLSMYKFNTVLKTLWKLLPYDYCHGSESEPTDNDIEEILKEDKSIYMLNGKCFSFLKQEELKNFDPYHMERKIKNRVIIHGIIKDAFKNVRPDAF